MSNAKQLRQIHAGEVMTSPVTYVMTETPVKEIALAMLKGGISAVPVIDQAGRLVGIVSEGDLIQRHVDDPRARRSWWLDLFDEDATHTEEFLTYLARQGLRAKDVMVADVITVAEDTPIAIVAELLDRHQIKRVPVLQGGRMVGIVSRADLLRVLARMSATGSVGR